MVPAASARRIVAQHALVGCESGVRSPLQVVFGSQKSWLVFPAHNGDLHSHVRSKRRLRENEAQKLFNQVAATVAHCHDQGVVLRDLKLRKFVFNDPQR